RVRSRGGVAPYGYRWHKGKLMIEEAEAPVRRLIYDLFLKHRRKKTVAKLLNDLGYRTRNKALFSDVAVDRLLRDTTAKGIRLEQNNAEIRVDPLVSEDIWERANTLLGNRLPKQAVNLFAGIASCSCGGKMSVPANSNKYICTGCRSKIPAEDLEAVFHSQVKPFAVPGGFDLFNDWGRLRIKEKRMIVEQICETITVARESISIRFACDPSLFKTTTFDQQLEPSNETPIRPSIEMPDASDVAEPLLSEVEASQFLGISKMTLLRKRNAGLIGFFRVGFRVLYSKEKHLLPYLAKCEVLRQH
ncbi:MAG TPA: recombinase family protein, partial [Pyrinomonadaceae bacterium]|nr:recombinase family protein [Pyrinomonadaceae bacterium]